MFIRLLSKLPVDVLILCPNLNNKCCLEDDLLYEEGLNEDTVQKAIRAISNADLLIIGGTSLVVYPAAGLINYFRGKHLVLVNKSATDRDSEADLLLSASIGEVFGQLK